MVHGQVHALTPRPRSCYHHHAMRTLPSASVIVNNYNYGRFLADAIDSALAQTHPDVEVVVVDDGSTDESRAVIARYGDRIVPVLKENGGQASAFNRGFRASRGEVVLFLDSDDTLLPAAMERAADALRDPGVARVHFPLYEVARDGARTGVVVPSSGPLAEGDLRETVLRDGPVGYTWAPTTGNAWARRALDRMLPMPEEEYRTCADTYLALLAPFLGELRRLPEPLGTYREHGDNNRLRISHADAARMVGHCLDTLRAFLGDPAFSPDLDRWRARWRWPDLDEAMVELARLLPPDARFAMADAGRFGRQYALVGRAVPLADGGGALPATAEEALAALERRRAEGVGFLVVAWPAFPWLDGLPSFAGRLRASFPCLLDDARLRVFDLRARGGAGRAT
jgi:glycosyltransferase involved in cell wall biosynthesis